jgi:hypothetical protein
VWQRRTFGPPVPAVAAIVDGDAADATAAVVDRALPLEPVVWVTVEPGSPRAGVLFVDSPTVAPSYMLILDLCATRDR